MRSLARHPDLGLSVDVDHQSRRRLEEGLVGTEGPLRDKSTGLELTHPDTTGLLVEMALAGRFAPHYVLDPAAGYGNFLFEAATQSPTIERLVGFETDPKAVIAARGRLWEFASRGVELELHEQDALDAEITKESFDLVICNPPYVRIHRMQEQRESFRKRFETASGRFDLYFLFFELATKALRSGGRLAFITSNKFMTTTSGGALRHHLRENYAPLRIVDFRDASPFKAAVLASVVVLEKAGKYRGGARVVELERVASGGEPGSLAQLAVDPVPAFVKVPRLGAPPLLARSQSSAIREWGQSSAPWHLGGQGAYTTTRLLDSAPRQLGNLLPRFTVGIKSTADQVFIKPFDEATALSGIVEMELLHPLVRGGTIRRWHTTWDASNGYDRYVLYPHVQDARGRTVATDLERYPMAKAFLESHREELESRKYVTAAGRRWFEIWVPQKVDVMNTARKLVFPDFATSNTFALETTGSFVGSSAAFAIPRSEATNEDLFFLLYLLNSPLYDYLHKRHFGTSILARRYRYWTQHVSKYPVPWPTAALRKELADQALAAASTGVEPECHLERAVSAFPLTKSEQALTVKEVSDWLAHRSPS